MCCICSFHVLLFTLVDYFCVLIFSILVERCLRMDTNTFVKIEKRKHNSLSITKKVELLQKLEKETSVVNLCIRKSTIYDSIIIQLKQ